MKGMKTVELLAQVLVLVGALNWGLVGAFDVDAVKQVFGYGQVSRAVYVLVGVSALYLVACRLM